MTRDDIYDHLAQVYLGKRKQIDRKKKKQFGAWLVINIVITGIIFASAIYGLTAFLAQRRSLLESKIIYSLHNGPIRFYYNFELDVPPVKTFELGVSEVDVTQYQKLQFSIRAKEEGNPGILKVVLTNQKGEVSAYYIQGVDYHWQDFSLPLEDFSNITDWTTVTSISFILESWNVDKRRGLILIDDIHFSS